MRTQTLTRCPKCSIGTLTSDYGDDPSCYACGYVDVGALPVGLALEQDAKRIKLPDYFRKIDGTD